MHHDEMMPHHAAVATTKKLFYDGYYHNKLANDYHNFSLIVEGKDIMEKFNGLNSFRT